MIYRLFERFATDYAITDTGEAMQVSAKSLKPTGSNFFDLTSKDSPYNFK